VGLVASLIVGTFLAIAQPSTADTVGRPDDPTPDYTYTAVEGPWYAENKGSGGAAALLKDTGAAAAATLVTFPYVKYNWTIYSWASTSNGLRFYGVYYNNEQVFYDYRVPWIKVGGNRYQLTASLLTAGPDLWEYNTGVFVVKATYNLGTPNVDVTVLTRFYGSGTMEPWVLVDTKGVPSALQIPERFDFDLAGSGDDNQQYYNGSAWCYSTTETSQSDSAFGENSSGYQWRTFDTDQLGTSYVYNVEIDVTPFHADNAIWYQLVYAASEISGDPGIYQSGQTINSYNPAAPDPWTGYDAVNWYVASYTATAAAYPGPWIKVKI